MSKVSAVIGLVEEGVFPALRCRGGAVKTGGSLISHFQHSTSWLDIHEMFAEFPKAGSRAASFRAHF